MNKTEAEKLLSDRRVVEEIHRHLWIESEKVGHDIGFEQAKEDWLKNFSKAWMAYHLPEGASKRRPVSKDSAKEVRSRKSPKTAASKKTKERSSSKKRRAKTYVE